MRDYMKSKAFHQHMRLSLAPKMQELGWELQSGNICAFKRSRWSIWFQISKNSNGLTGGRFTINFNTSRLLVRLNKSDRAIGKALEKHLIARLPKPDPAKDFDVEVLGENGEKMPKKFSDLMQPDLDQWGRPRLSYHLTFLMIGLQTC